MKTNGMQAAAEQSPMSSSNIIVFKKPRKVSLIEFYQRLFDFLFEIGLITDEEDFYQFVFSNQKDIRYFLDKHGIA